MTDKQMIIDGVDVGGCVQFIQDEKDCCNLGGSCKGWTNCYYKNWKRKEQECERLKAEYTRVHTQLAAQEAYILVDGEEVWRGSTRKLKQENEKLKAENERLKADLKSLEYTVVLQGKRDIDNAADLFAKHIAKIESENSILKAENTELKYKAEFYENYNNAHINKITKLEKTLTEIKEIAKGTNPAFLDNDDVVLEILQKISECEVENEGN